MSIAAYQLIAVANWATCLGIAWVAICRLNLRSCQRRLRQRARYAALLGGASASGMSPLLFGEWPGVGTLLFSAGLLCALVFNAPSLHHIYREGD